MSSQLGRKSPHVCFIQKALASRSLLKRHESYYSKDFLLHLCKCELILLSKWHLFLRSQWLILCVMNCSFIGQNFPYIVKKVHHDIYEGVHEGHQKYFFPIFVLDFLDYFYVSEKLEIIMKWFLMFSYIIHKMIMIQWFLRFT